MRSKANTKSPASTGEPSWKVMSARSLKVKVLPPSVTFQLSAAAGTTSSRTGSHRVSPSKSWRATRTDPGSWIRMGSRVAGSEIATSRTLASASKTPGVGVASTGVPSVVSPEPVAVPAPAVAVARAPGTLPPPVHAVRQARTASPAAHREVPRRCTRATTWGSVETQREEDRRPRKDDRRDDRDAVEVLLHHRGPHRLTLHPAAEHLGHSSPPARVQKDEQDESEGSDYVDDDQYRGEHVVAPLSGSTREPRLACPGPNRLQDAAAHGEK